MDSISVYEPRSNFIAGFVFEVLIVIALIGFLVWACLIPNHRRSMRGVIVSLVTWLLYAMIYCCPWRKLIVIVSR